MGKIKKAVGANIANMSYMFSNEKPGHGSDEGAEELSTTINCTTTNNENSILPEDQSPG